MGLTMARLTLKNPRRPELPPVEVEALADTGSNYLCIPESIRAQLQLDDLEMKRTTVADGRTQTAPYVGPVQLQFKNRGAFTGALVLGNQVLLGAIPMEDMDLVVIPGSRTVDVNPASPDIASARV